MGRYSAPELAVRQPAIRPAPGEVGRSGRRDGHRRRRQLRHGHGHRQRRQLRHGHGTGSGGSSGTATGTDRGGTASSTGSLGSGSAGAGCGAAGGRGRGGGRRRRLRGRGRRDGRRRGDRRPDGRPERGALRGGGAGPTGTARRPVRNSNAGPLGRDVGMARRDHRGARRTDDLQRHAVRPVLRVRLGDRGAGDADRGGGDGDHERLAEQRLEEAGEPEARRDPAQRALAAAGPALGRRAVAAGAGVGAQQPATLVAQRLLLDQRAGGLAAENVVELLPDRPPRAEDERLDCRLADRERGCDLGVGAALELAQDERFALAGRKLGQSGAERLGPTTLGRLDRHLIELDLDRAALPCGQHPPALVVGDLDQPVARLLHLLAAGEGTEGPDVGRLDDVLGIRAGAQDHQDVPQDLIRVAPIQPIHLGRGVSAPDTEDSGVTCDDDHCLGKTP